MSLSLVRSRLAALFSTPAQRERFVFFALLTLYTVVQLVNIGRGGHMGQDWVTQKRWLQEAATRPWDWLVGNFYETNPPLYHLLTAPFLVFLRPRFAFEAMGFANVLVNVAGLWAFWKTVKILVDSIWIRFAALLSVAFLPACVIGSVVIASDALCQLPVCVLGLCFALYATNKIRSYQALLIATAAVAFAVSIKATDIVLVPTVVFGFYLVARIRKHLSFAFLGGLALFAALTGLLGLYWNFCRPSNVQVHFHPEIAAGAHPEQPMNIRSVLFFRAGDVSFFRAPSVWELYNEWPPSLHASNSLSYPGLLWLSLHTDILNVLQPHKRLFAWGSIGVRTNFSRKISRISVRIGIVTFCFSAVAVVAAAVWAFWLYFTRADRNSAVVLAILLMAGAWTAAMTTIVMIVHYAYAYQYWHPRLMLPAVVLFAIPVAWMVSRVLFGRPLLQIAFLVGSICQAIVHLGVIIGR
jgi:hypothetical protein